MILLEITVILLNRFYSKKKRFFYSMVIIKSFILKTLDDIYDLIKNRKEILMMIR